MKLVFCFTTILRNSHREIFDIDRLLEEGYNVNFLDLTSLHGGNPTYEDSLIKEITLKCENLNEVKKFVYHNKDNKILYICNDVHLTNAYDTFKILIKCKDKVLAYNTKSIPGQETKLLGSKAFLNKILKSKYYYPFFSKPLYQLFYKYKAPDFFLSNTKYCLPQKVYLTVPQKNIFVVHSDDVNRILKYKSNVQKDFEKQKIGVFLDQLIPFSYKEKIPKGYEDIYYARIERSLTTMKEKLGLDEIIIAMHPECQVYQNELKNRFTPFKKSYGKTEILIDSAYVVFGHFSTSIGIAAFLKKPIIILKDSTLFSIEKIKTLCKEISNELNLIEIDMDKKDISIDQDLNLDLHVYNKFIKKFMKDSEVNENSYYHTIKTICKY